MLEARCMQSVSLTVRYLSSPETVTTTMDSIPPRFESLSSNFYQLIRNKYSKLFMCRCVRFLPAAASRFSITKSLPLFLLRSVRISENHRFYSLTVELIETIAVCQPWIRGSVRVDQNVYDQVLPQFLPAYM